jgi:hypothetical protein
MPESKGWRRLNQKVGKGDLSSWATNKLARKEKPAATRAPRPLGALDNPGADCEEDYQASDPPMRRSDD